MKMNMKTILTILLTGMTLFLANCSKSNDSSSSTTSSTPYCNGQAGYVSTQYGCLAESTCSSLRGQNGYSYYGYYNGYCVGGTSTSTTTTTTTSTSTPYCNGQSGYVRTAYGCLPESYCSASRGYNGVAFYGYFVSNNTGYCAPQTGTN